MILYAKPLSARSALACWMLAGLLMLMGWEQAQACNVPVFRYALERWTPDPYEVVIVHEGPLTAQEKKVVDSLQSYLEDPRGCPTNASLTVIDLSKEVEERWEKVIAGRKFASFPWMIVRFPQSADLKTSLHEGPLDAALLQQLFDSPTRRTLAQRLLQGQTAVWLMIDSGQKEQDEAKAALITGEMKKLEQNLKLPELTESPKDKVRSDLALKIDFSLLRVSRQDEKEKALVRILLGMEEDLPTRTEPIVFPVFGRGLALWAIVGKGINEDNIERAARFLVGPCSCEVKSQNPGVDLLMTAAWEDGLEGRFTKTPELPPLTGLIPEPESTSEGTASSQETRQVPKCIQVPASSGDSGAPVLWHNVYLVLGGGLVVLVLGSLLVFFRR